MGRHSESKAGLVTTAVIAAVLLVVGGGAWAMSAVLSDDAPDASSAAVTPSSSSSAASSSPSPSDSASSSASSSPSPSASATPALSAEARTACTNQVRAAEAIGAAAKNSAAHWKSHTDAYLQKKSGKYTLAQTAAQYAASKKFGLADEKAIAATTKTFTATGAACRDAAKAAPDDAGVTACTTRLKAFDAVRVTGTKVQDEWSAHMRMMAKKAHTDGGSYYKTWLTAVASAQKSVPAYAAAAAAASKAPACA